MKTFFKYEFGYINLDSDNLYLTNSGNWSEVKNLKEKSSIPSGKDGFRRFRIALFFVLASILLTGIFFVNITSGRKSFFLLVLIPIGIYKLYTYMRQDLGSRFFIPLEKIDAVEYDQDRNGYLLRFRNRENDSVSEFIRNVGGEDFDRLVREAIEAKIINL